VYYAPVFDSWVSVPAPRADATWRLVCFPHAGGGASSFFPWARELSAVPVEVATVRLPGREARLREAPIEDLPELLEHLDAALDGSVDTRPMVWFGHSSGARIAFELARLRRSRGGTLPQHLIVSGAPAPDVVRLTPTLHRIASDDEFLSAVASAYGGVPSAVLAHAELRALVAPALRADLKMHERYVYTDAAPLPMPITAFGGTADQSVSEEWLKGWARHTVAEFRSQLFAGDHFYLHESRTRSELLRALVQTVSRT
jgi:medium-chain acyl-[acyl-carrier-protein] hydrolase